MSKRAKAGGSWAQADYVTNLARMRAAVDGGDPEGVAKAMEDMADALHAERRPSMAAAIGGPGKAGPLSDRPAFELGNQERVKRHPFIKATLGKGHGDYQSGSLVTAIAWARDRDADRQGRGKAILSDLGIREVESGPDIAGYGGMIGLPGYTAGAIGKATLGTTGATGGYVLPNNLVDDVVKPEIGQMDYSRLCTFVNGVSVRGVDQPWRTSAPNPATVTPWGQEKENVDEAYGSYTATLGTFAKIYDVGKQYLRFSAGAAERDVFDELGKSFNLAERKAILAGAGGGALTPGVGDPTVGIYTSLLAADPTFTTVFASPSTSTIAGNFATAVAQGLAKLVARGQTPNAILTDAVSYWTLWQSGSDAAGYFAAGAAMGGARTFGVNANGDLTLWNIPILFEPYYDSWTGSTKTVILGNFRKLKVFRGSEFRIDSSDQAGDRWSQNLIGYRGEEELGVHAGAAVATGAFQLIKNAIP
jgi:HK97 family phage major capsid protein